MLKHYTLDEMQAHCEGCKVREAEDGESYLVEDLKTHFTIGIPASLPEKVSLDSLFSYTPTAEERAQVCDILALPDEVRTTYIYVTPGVYSQSEDVFWAFRLGDLPTHIILTMNFRPCITDEDLRTAEQAMADRNHPLRRFIEPERKDDSRITLAACHHLLEITDQLRPLIHTWAQAD